MESRAQQGYAFGVWLNAIHKITSPIFINGYGFLPCDFHRDDLRNLLKLLDFENYPRDERALPFSYAIISKSELARHMEFISSEIYHSGFVFNQDKKNFENF